MYRIRQRRSRYFQIKLTIEVTVFTDGYHKKLFYENQGFTRKKH